MKSLAFFFPYRVVSGCPVLFLNVARKISILYSTVYKLYVVDYEDGYMASNIAPEDNITIIPFQDGVYCDIDTDYIIMQAYLPEAIRPEFRPGKESKVLMWVLYPWNFFPIVFPFNFMRNFIESHEELYCKILCYCYKGELRKSRLFLEHMQKTHSVVFMDKPTIDATEKALSICIDNPTYIPIASSDPTAEKYNKENHKNTIHLGWVGRLCDFKIHILNCAMKKAHEYADIHHQSIVFHVVGNGELEHLLYNGESNYFKCNWVGSIKKDELDRYMSEHFDINFAMGTSVIESAKLRIPTVKLDISYTPVSSDYVFRWFHETKDYDMGHRITNADLISGNDSFEQIIRDFKEQKELLGIKDFAFYERNYSLSVVSKMIHDQLQAMTSSWADIPNELSQKGFIRRIYYIEKYGIS